MDFNGLVRHYYLRQMPHDAEVRVNLVGKKHRELQSHAIGLRIHDRLPQSPTNTMRGSRSSRCRPVRQCSRRRGRGVRPPGALLRGPDARGRDGRRAVSAAEPGVVEVDDTVEAQVREAHVRDRPGEGCPERGLASTRSPGRSASSCPAANAGRCGSRANEIRCGSSCESPWTPLQCRRIWRASESKGRQGSSRLSRELGRWETTRVDQTIYHKNLQRVAYVFAETLGRTPAESSST